VSALIDRTVNHIRRWYRLPVGAFTTTIRATSEREAIFRFLRNHPHRSVSTVIVRPSILLAAVEDA
jgi:hypothetical protein